MCLVRSPAVDNEIYKVFPFSVAHYSEIVSFVNAVFSQVGESIFASLRYLVILMSLSISFIETYSEWTKTKTMHISLPVDFFWRWELYLNSLFAGVHRKPRTHCSNTLHPHWSNHDSVLQEVARASRLVANTINFVQSLSVMIGGSSKYKSVPITILTMLCATYSAFFR